MTTRVELLLVLTGSVVLDDTVAVLVMVPLLPVMKKFTWKVIVAPAGTVARAGIAGAWQVRTLPTGGGQPSVLEMYLPCLTFGSACVMTTFCASDGPLFVTVIV